MTLTVDGLHDGGTGLAAMIGCAAYSPDLPMDSSVPPGQRMRSWGAWVGLKDRTPIFICAAIDGSAGSFNIGPYVVGEPITITMNMVDPGFKLHLGPSSGIPDDAPFNNRTDFSDEVFLQHWGEVTPPDIRWQDWRLCVVLRQEGVVVRITDAR